MQSTSIVCKEVIVNGMDSMTMPMTMKTKKKQAVIDVDRRIIIKN